MIALAVPHTPWIPARQVSMSALRKSLDVEFRGRHIVRYREFTEKCPNWMWSQELWEWGAQADCDHLLQLQDDVIPAQHFWAILDAMLAAVPNKIIALQGAHPAFRFMARDGHNWAVSCAWMVGVGYVIPKADLAALCEFRRIHDARAHFINEDDFIAEFCVATDREIWHPLPTIIDHDTTVESTYGNGDHMYRRPTVTWREYDENDLCGEAFWARPEHPVMVANPHGESCWFCCNEPGHVASSATKARIGMRCLRKALDTTLERIQ